MTIQSPGDAASTAAWMERNWPRLPCQVPTVHTLGRGLPRAGAAAAAPPKPDPSKTAAVAAAATRSHNPEMARRARAGDVAVRKAIHPLANPATAERRDTLALSAWNLPISMRQPVSRSHGPGRRPVG